MDVKIPDKVTFSRRDVMRLTRLDGRVIDYWEREFSTLQPVKTNAGDKHYSRRDVERIFMIKRFLVEQRLDKDEVRKRLRAEDRPAAMSTGEKKVRSGPEDPLRVIRDRLENILTLLDKHDKK